MHDKQLSIYICVEICVLNRIRLCIAVELANLNTSIISCEKLTSRNYWCKWQKKSFFVWLKLILRDATCKICCIA